MWRALYEDCFCVYAHDIETAMLWKGKCNSEKVPKMRDAILGSSWDAEDSNTYTWQIQKMQSLVVSPQALCKTTILYHKSSYCFYLLPQKSLLKSSHPKKYLPKFSFSKKFMESKIQTQKYLSHIPVTLNWD